jgi:DNA-binding transcriptional ArsR family regulator
MSGQPFLVDTPERLRALSDPLRQRLLAAFVQEPGTVKAVAARLGEPVTKLYRHVDLLLAAGFLRVAGEQRRRGVIERTFEAAADRFVVAPTGSAADRIEQGDGLARAALEEVLSGASTDAGSGRLHLMRASVRLTPGALASFEDALRTLLQKHVSEDGVPTELLLVAALKHESA